MICKPEILGKEMQIAGWTKGGNLLLADGREYIFQELKPTSVDIRCRRLLAVEELTYSERGWLLSGRTLHDLPFRIQRHLANARNIPHERRTPAALTRAFLRAKEDQMPANWLRDRILKSELDRLQDPKIIESIHAVAWFANDDELAGWDQPILLKSFREVVQNGTKSELRRIGQDVQQAKQAVQHLHDTNAVAHNAAQTTLEALHGDLRQLKDNLHPLPGAIANVGERLDTMHKHVQGVPILQAELAQSQNATMAAVAEMNARIAKILTLKEQRICTAVNKAGSQKGALASLRKDDIVKSLATLCRLVQAINKKLKENGLPPCCASGPVGQFKETGGYVDKEGELIDKEISSVDQTWTEDPIGRDTTIQGYLTASPEDKVHYQHTYPDIEAEAKEYLEHRSLKSS